MMHSWDVAGKHPRPGRGSIGVLPEILEGDADWSERSEDMVGRFDNLAGRNPSSSYSSQPGSPSDAVPVTTIDIHEIMIQRMIGQGMYSEVFLGSLRGENFAVKVVHDSDCQQEVNLLRSVKHPNVVLMHHAMFMDNSTHIVMELCIGGSLFHLMHERNGKLGAAGPSWPQRMRICLDTASAMEYLHGRKPQIIHRDLKSLNVLLKHEVTNRDDLPQVKVTDLGLSRTMKRQAKQPGDDVISESARSSGSGRSIGSGGTGESVHMTMNVGTLQWMAPEVHMSEDYDEKVDVYSFAMVLYEVAWQRIPFYDDDKRCHFSMERVILGARPNISELPPGCPEELPALIKVCWSRTASGRPTFAKIRLWLKVVAAEKGYNKWTVAL